MLEKSNPLEQVIFVCTIKYHKLGSFSDVRNRFAVVFPPVSFHFKTLIILNRLQKFKYKESIRSIFYKNQNFVSIIRHSSNR